MTALQVEVDGAVRPLDDCIWVHFAPCGCMSGATVTVSRRDVKATAEQAADAMYDGDSPGVRERDEKLGFRFELVTRERYMGLIIDCPHDPKWGVPPVPTPTGMRWAVPGYNPTRRARLHLVPEALVDEEFEAYQARGYAKAPSLCGSTKAYPWRQNRFGSRLHCTPCQRKAVSA